MPTAPPGKGSIRPFILDGRIGPTYLVQSQSHALRYLFKPELRLGARIGYGERWEFGGTVDALLDASEHYRVLGILGHARFAALRAGTFSLGVSAAVGVGYDADILHSNLRASGRIAPYYFAALDGRWQIGSWLIGLESGYANMALVQAGLLVGYVFHE